MSAASPRVGVVTDSTAYLPPDLVEAYGLTIVPLQVVVGGRSLAEGVEVTSDEVAIYLYVATREYLRRGGRVGAAAAMVGSALAVKPLLHLADGRLEPVERVRTASRALARLEELVVRAAGRRPVDVAVQHLAA